jgi:type II secretory pathway component GspD/PulD (secretin)
VPGLSRIPLLGYLFQNVVQIEETRELVIILSASLV